jgi:2-desacetyl-2-hydroxyethyl bacteriochlorophyllide A dehydrogenase
MTDLLTESPAGARPRMRQRVARVVEHAGPRAVRVVEEPMPEPGAGQVSVATRVTAISAGTELLVYRGEVPDDAPLDDVLPALDGRFSWPVRYGYAAVGTITAGGAGVQPERIGREVFAFQPHRDRFVAPVTEVVPLPAGMDAEAAVLLPGVETALGLVMDGRPLPGERILVVGLGAVGLLTTGILAHMPLAALVAVDPLPERRRHALRLGAGAALDPDDAAALRRHLGGDGADLTYELTGNPAALDVAIRETGREGRLILGSWYGTRRASVDLGTHFHRGRLTVRSSQVSRIDPALCGRWSKARRLAFALELIPKLRPERLITHRFPIDDAPAAFHLLDTAPEHAIQVLITYDDANTP